MQTKFTLLLFLAGAISSMAWAQHDLNMPIIQTKYTADPAPYVHGDTVYLYTTHDEDDAEGFKMRDWLLYTSTDMVNWQDHGAVASLRDFKWYKGDNGAWAGQQRYATVVWNGDTHASWASFRQQIPSGLNYMATGNSYWTVDVGSFFTRDDGISYDYKKGRYQLTRLVWNDKQGKLTVKGPARVKWSVVK